ncbi:MAG: hypothetical protein HY040_27500 [Planctomycetes bacterium]|nr:hypothetical protein [Planctomycetota bacterium]
MSTLNDQDRENLVAYLDGELGEEAAQALEAKLNVDPTARAEVEALRQTWGMLDYLPRPAPSTTFTTRTMDRLSVERLSVRTGKMPVAARTRWLSYVGWAAAVLVAAAGGFGLANLIWPAAKNHVERDEILVKHLGVVEKLGQYQNVDDIAFLQALADPDLFGEEES